MMEQQKPKDGFGMCKVQWDCLSGFILLIFNGNWEKNMRIPGDGQIWLSLLLSIKLLTSAGKDNKPWSDCKQIQFVAHSVDMQFL